MFSFYFLLHNQDNEIRLKQFDIQELNRLQEDGQLVLVNVTANWCLSCKLRYWLINSTISKNNINSVDQLTIMHADWTTENFQIDRFLRYHDHSGVPYTILFGPAAPDGVELPFFLTRNKMFQALRKAQGS